MTTTTAVNPKPVLHVIAPLVAFYGLRALGAPAFVALLAGAGVPAAPAVHGIAAQRRVGGMQVFVPATTALTVLFAAMGEQNWTQYPAFRTLLRRRTAIRGTVLLLDAALRVGVALSAPRRSTDPGLSTHLLDQGVSDALL